jgi:hypothetical protein
MTVDDWRLVFEGVVATIAILSLILSLANLAYTWWTNRPHLRVTLTVGILGQAGGGLGPTLFIVSAANIGRVPITLSSVGVDLRSPGDTGVFIGQATFSPPLPYTLEPGRSWQYHIDPAEVIALHVGTQGPVRGPFVNDQTGKHWSGSSKRSWLDSWAKRAP